MLSKSTSGIDAWAQIAQGAIREGGIQNLDSSYSHLLFIDLALINATAHLGTEIIVEISSSDSGDEFWSELHKFVVGVGTATSENITDNPLSIGSTTLLVSDTTGFTNNSKLLFLKDVSIIANSEIVRQVTYSAGVSISIIDGTTREHAVNSVLWSIVNSLMVELPMSARRVRVIYNNAYDGSGAIVASRSRISQVVSV